MQPALPDEPQRVWASADDASPVGAYRQGTPTSRWALARYLVGRVIGEAVSNTLFVVAAVLLVVAVALQLTLHWTFLDVLIAIIAVIVLVVRWIMMAVLRRLTAAEVYGPVAQQLSNLVGDTRRDVFRELRRLDLPSHTLTLPALGFRLAGRRHTETMDRLREFDVDRAVPPARVDELHMLLGSKR